jgi:hypothetical protein
VQGPSDHDIRTWCAACSAEDQVADLIAQARAVESMYLEFRRQTRGGMKQFMLAPVPLYERTERFRIYEHHVIPGLFQTVSYARAMLQFWFGYLETHYDMDEAVAARMAGQAVLYEGPVSRSVRRKKSPCTPTCSSTSANPRSMGVGGHRNLPARGHERLPGDGQLRHET